MYKITSIEIKGFWGRFSAKSSFADGVNIIIGKNGTGKTTFMNILYAILGVDSDALYENEFSEVLIKLSDAGKSRTIRATREELEGTPFPVVTYYISRNKYLLPVMAQEDVRGYSPAYRRRAVEDSAKIRTILAEFVNLASLSVYRHRQDPDVEVRERARRTLSPVDSRLQDLRQRLTQYQLELSNEARNISIELQKNVLVSLLYSAEQINQKKYSLAFSEDREKRDLVSAYKQLGLSGPDITGRIQKHVSAVGQTLRAIENSEGHLDFAPLEARAMTSNVIDLSLAAEKRTEAVFSQVNGFLRIITSFIPEKKFSFAGGELTVVGSTAIPLPKLSSGEKQLLILLIEALLQKEQPFIFLADEPELSLHISWQRQIISAIVKLNPNAQIIVATHSPEIAGRFKDQIIDMEDILHG